MKESRQFALPPHTPPQILLLCWKRDITLKGSHESDPFWTKAETALLQALMLYLIQEAPEDEQNFAMILEMIANAEVREEDEP